MIDKINSKTLTLLAFLIGYSLLDELSTQEQNALGNWFMLIGQVLCTNSSDNFRREQKTNDKNKDYLNDLMNKVKNSIDNSISKL